VALGLGQSHGISTVNARPRANLILPLFNNSRRCLREACATACSRSGTNWFPRPEHSSDGRQQAFAALERFLHRHWAIPQDHAVRHLIQQLDETELEAVLAHEIGHYKKRHILKMLAWSALGSFVTFCVIAWLSRQEWFYNAFGFPRGSLAPAFLLLRFWAAQLRSGWRL
jgi:hypothetical protein